MSKKEKTNPLINFRRQEIDLVKFNEQTDKEQKEQIQKLLEDAYGDSLKIDRKYIMKVLRLTWNPKDDFTYLPYNLKVTKDKLNLSFEVVKKKPIPLGLLIFLIWLFCFALIGATYIFLLFSICFLYIFSVLFIINSHKYFFHKNM